MKLRYRLMLLLLVGILVIDSCTQRNLHLANQQTKSQIADDSLKTQASPLIKDKETAIAVAEPILFRKFGKKHILRQKPYEVEQINEYWVIHGSLPEGSVGGVFEITLDGRDAKLIKVIHGQ